MRLPNVDEALDIGYALHAADDPALRGKIQQEHAQHIYRRFRSLTAEPGTPEDAYLRCIDGIILVHARGISRRKEHWIKELEEAAGARNKKLEKIRETHWKTSGVNIAWLVLKPLVLGLSGYLVAQVLGLVLPAEIHQQTSTVFSILVSLVFVLMGRSATFFMQDAERNRIEAEFKIRSYHAILAYELGKRQEYRTYRERLCEAWLQYTDETYPLTASYELVMAGDIETREKFERQMRMYDRTAIWLLGRMARILRRGRRKEVEEEVVATETPAA